MGAMRLQQRNNGSAARSPRAAGRAQLGLRAHRDRSCLAWRRGLPETGINRIPSPCLNRHLIATVEENERAIGNGNSRSRASRHRMHPPNGAELVGTCRRRHAVPRAGKP